MIRAIDGHAEVQAYLNEVCAQVKAKDVHEDIRLEMLNHLEELTEELIEDRGLSEKEAVIASLKQMGDAGPVGKSLHEAHKPKPEWTVIAIVTGMIVIALLSLIALPASSLSTKPFAPKLIYGIVGIAFMSIMYFANYKKLLYLSWPLYGATIGFMIWAYLNPHRGDGTGHWFYINESFPFDIYSLSPYLLILAFAGILHAQKNKSYSSNPYLKLLLRGVFAIRNLFFMAIVPMFLYFQTPDFDGLIFFIIGFLILLIISGRKGLAAAICAVVPISVLFDDYDKHQLIYGLQRLWEGRNSPLAAHSLETIREGGLWGNGVGLALDRLPLIETEMLFSYLVYSFGWFLGAAIALAAFMFILRIIRMALQVQDEYGKWLLIGISTIFALKLLWNLLMCLGISPFIAVSLPLLQWGSSSVVEFALVGLMLSVHRRKDMIGRNKIVEPLT
ncbi:FtsW/RodA/SpoVE family cell cycle protein [Paenibacillus sp. GCM10027627]|uniref:FtsW/RodA/SpoVE family cell cycle protein n=1 Tax=unclassified Paenibacillus TaxID=185978 RepID=UPI003624B0E9